MQQPIRTYNHGRREWYTKRLRSLFPCESVCVCFSASERSSWSRRLLQYSYNTMLARGKNKYAKRCSFTGFHTATERNAPIHPRLNRVEFSRWFRFVSNRCCLRNMIRKTSNSTFDKIDVAFSYKSLAGPFRNLISCRFCLDFRINIRNYPVKINCLYINLLSITLTIWYIKLSL